MAPISDVRRASAPPGGAVWRRLPELDGVAPMDAAELLRDLPGLALLESARPGRTGRWSLLAVDPVAVLDVPGTDALASTAAPVLDGMEVLAQARRLLARLASGAATTGASGPAANVTLPPFAGGLIGFLAYDFGRRLERIPAIAARDQLLPDLRLGLYDRVVAWDRRSGAAYLGGRAVDGDAAALERRLDDLHVRLLAPRPAATPPAPAASAPPELRLTRTTTRERWVAGVEAVRSAIARGHIYQANLTRRLETPFSGDPWPLFRRLRTGDPALFAAYLDLGPTPAGASRALLSASPEPFLAVDGDGRVATDPIKGTRRRGRTREQDHALARELLQSAKDKAENVMIVDVLRNDLGRVCLPGTVTVPRFLRLERTAAVQHLVTTVTGRLRPDADAFDLLAASFPGGSITGAPKIRAMELIEELEPVRRGPYCGSMVWLGPDGRMGSSILIRTLVADGQRLSLHVGGGITWRSDPDDEWDETVAKARGPLSSIGAVEVDA